MDRRLPEQLSRALLELHLVWLASRRTGRRLRRLAKLVRERLFAALKDCP
jgi:hypothetical protein